MYVGADPLGFVISENLHRRHLDESQRGMVAARLARLSEGRPKTVSIDTVKIPDRKEAGAMMNVGEATVARAKKIQKHGVPELVEAVDKGDVTVHAAHKVAMLPKEEQSAIVQQGPEAVKKKAAELRTEPKPAAEYAAPEVLRHSPHGAGSLQFMTLPSGK